MICYERYRRSESEIRRRINIYKLLVRYMGSVQSSFLKYCLYQ